jgi:RHS repeat-associated protein
MYDRSLGTVTNDSTGKPYQLLSATQAAVGGQHNGSVDAVIYDAAGNLRGMQLTRSGTVCSASPSACSSTFAYDWDEVGRLSGAHRTDASGAAVSLQYGYDSGDKRVLKHVSSGAAQPVTTAYIFETLELRRTSFNAATQQYLVNSGTEVVYLRVGDLRLARIEYEPANWGEPRSTPTLEHPANVHVLLELSDQLGSSSLTIDQSTGELVELRTYQPYGATESDYRPARWKGIREDYGFTGKEEDIELGLSYFGRRYYSPYLGRWISPDPLAVHRPGSADLNLYAYVSGQVYAAVDPLGLEKTAQERLEEAASYAGQGLDIAGNVMVEGFHLLGSTTAYWGCACSFQKTEKILSDYARDRALKIAARQEERAVIARTVQARELKEGENFVKTLVDASKACWKDQNRCGLRSASAVADDFLKLSGKLAAQGKEAVWNLAQTVRGHFIENILAKSEFKGWQHVGKGFTESIDFVKGKLFMQLKTFDASDLKDLKKALKDLEKLAAESPNRQYILEVRTRTQEQAEWILEQLKSAKVQINAKKW